MFAFLEVADAVLDVVVTKDSGVPWTVGLGIGSAIGGAQAPSPSIACSMASRSRCNDREWAFEMLEDIDERFSAIAE